MLELMNANRDYDIKELHMNMLNKKGLDHLTNQNNLLIEGNYSGNTSLDTAAQQITSNSPSNTKNCLWIITTFIS